MSNPRINPFYISSAEYDDIEDGDDDWDDYDGGDADAADYSWNNTSSFSQTNAQEQRRLMSSSGASSAYGKTRPQHQQWQHQQQSNQYHHNNKSGNFHDPNTHSSVAAVRTFHRQGSPYDYRHDGSPAWKISILIGIVIVFVFLIGSESSSRSSSDDDEYKSLKDLAPNDELRLVVIGERHSGVNWMHARLRECFPHADVSTELQRESFLFQDETAMNFNKRNTNKDPIVVMMTLNVYDWMEHMRLAPDHSPNHTARHSEYGHLVPLHFDDFVSRPWTMERPERDLPMQNNTKGRVCQQRFRYNEIVSCVEGPVMGMNNPMYELQNDGTPFPSIMDLRSAKLWNHYNVRNWTSVKKFELVPYEKVGQIFKSLVHEIQQFTEWQLSCDGDVLPTSKDQSASMSQQSVDYISKNADWDGAESIIESYKPWTKSDIDSKQIQDDASKTDAKGLDPNQDGKDTTDKDHDGSKSEASKSSGSQKDDDMSAGDSDEALPTEQQPVEAPKTSSDQATKSPPEEPKPAPSSSPKKPTSATSTTDDKSSTKSDKTDVETTDTSISESTGESSAAKSPTDQSAKPSSASKTDNSTSTAAENESSKPADGAESTNKSDSQLDTKKDKKIPKENTDNDKKEEEKDDESSG